MLFFGKMEQFCIDAKPPGVYRLKKTTTDEKNGQIIVVCLL